MKYILDTNAVSALMRADATAIKRLMSVTRADVAIPQPLNVFMDVRVDASGDMTTRPASSKAGDHLVFRALVDSYVVLSSCPMDIVAISSGGITPLAIDLDD